MNHEERKKYNLGDLVDVAQGLAINSKTKHLIQETGLPLLRITDLFNNTQIQFINPEEVPRQCIVNDNELIYTRTGQVGYVFKGKKGVVHNNCFKVILKSGVIDKEYLYWFLTQKTTRDYVNSIASGSAQKDLPHAAFKNIEIEIPSISTQHRIAKILSSLEDKIEVNHRTNGTLRTITRVVFKAWFIDFDPVRSKADGRQPTGMNAETAMLFPSSFDGAVPKGWKVAQFGDFLAVSRDRIGIEDAPEYSATVNGLSLRDKNFNKELSKSKVKNKRIIKDNLVFGLSRQTLNFGVMKETIGSVSPVYEIFHIDTSVYIPELLEMFIRLQMHEHIDILKPAAREGQAIDRNYLLTKKILVPDMKVQLRYQEFCSAFRNQIVRNEKESRTLASLRDSLLPKLMRGEVRVKDE